MAAPRPSAAVPSAADQAAARGLALRFPDLLVEARQVASTVSAGWHGRRRPGSGEDFWQFRPFRAGEAARVIDWRRSARDDTLYVREQELENAHTVWLAVDLGAAMQFNSELAPVTKANRALVLTLALAELLSRSGERVGLAGAGRPASGRKGAERLAEQMMLAGDRPQTPLAELTAPPIGRWHDLVVTSDFFGDADALVAALDTLAGRGVRVHLLQVMDPIEESFPFAGRTRFVDPAGGPALTADRAESWREAYLGRLEALRHRLKGASRQPGWSFLTHHTDRRPEEALLMLYERLAASGHGNGG